MVSFKEQRFFVLMSFNHFYLWAVFFYVIFKKSLLSSSQRFPPLFSFKNFIISDCTFSSMMHCKLIICSIRSLRFCCCCFGKWIMWLFKTICWKDYFFFFSVELHFALLSKVSWPCIVWIYFWTFPSHPIRSIWLQFHSS